MRKSSVSILVVAYFLALFVSASAQAPCKPPEVVYNRGLDNLFTAEQEVYLGDALAETLDKELKVIHDEAATKYLQSIGERLARHLPPNDIKFRFFIVDAPEVNALSVAGGRIYVTRKLVSFVKNEDELAGIIGHEMGHAVVRHTSLDFARAFREILQVQKLEGREDVYRRVHDLIDRARTKRLKVGKDHEDSQQIEADQIGVYAMAAAGYDPMANVTAWQRVTELELNEGSGGLFRRTRPEVKRMREMLRAVKELPQSCREVTNVSVGDGFRKWQSYVVSMAKIRHTEKLNGLVSKGRLQPHLRGSITSLRFSPDGRHVIAQDASGLNILSREPLNFLFRIPLQDAKYGMFSPDSKNVVVQTFGLRVEVWNIESRQAVSTSEVFVRDTCGQTSLSPDARTLLCYTVAGDLHLIDVNTSEKIFSKPNFFRPGVLGRPFWLASQSRRGEVDTLSVQYSPDSRYVVAGASFEPLIIGNLANALDIRSMLGAGEKETIAYDLIERKEIKLGKPLEDIVCYPFAFISNEKLVGLDRPKGEKSGIFSFPAGERIEKFPLSAPSLEATSSRDHLIVRPVGAKAAGVFSIADKKFVLTNKVRAVDGFGDMFVVEGNSGNVELVKVVAEKVETIASAVLPRYEIGDVQAIEVSDNLDRLAISASQRGGVFELKNGGRKVYLRGFRGSYIGPDGKILADFPKSDKEERNIVDLDFDTGIGRATSVVPKAGSTQIGQFLVSFQAESYYKSLIEEEAAIKSAESGKKGVKLNRSFIGNNEPWIFAVLDVTTGKELWSRKFTKDVPRYSFSPNRDTVTLWWPVASEEARDIIKKSPALNDKAKLLGEKLGDYLVQILDASNGTPKGHMLIETGVGSFRLQRAFAAGDWLTVTDSENRVLFYSMSSGELKGRAFGEFALVNPVSSIAVIENFPGILSVHDLQSQKRVGELRFPSSILFLKFTSDGSKLFVLTTNQEFYILDATKLADGQ